MFCINHHNFRKADICDWMLFFEKGPTVTPTQLKFWISTFSKIAKASSSSTPFFERCSDPDWFRTCGLRIRHLAFYRL